MKHHLKHLPTACVLFGLLVNPFAETQGASSDFSQEAQKWRRNDRIIDLHMHVGDSKERLERAVKIMDRAGIGIGVNLSGGTVTPLEGEKPSAFKRRKQLKDKLYPQRFVHYMNLDYSKWDDADFSKHAVRQIEKGHRLGAAGLKIYKRLGLFLKNEEGELVAVDDPKLDPVWERCGKLGMPVSIHTADPKAFWQPYNKSNERWAELKDHPSWWFGDSEKYPSREALLAARNRVVARHPDTTFVCLHFANNPESIDQVARWLEEHPNMKVDIAARVPELGRHEARKVHKLFKRFEDRILFGTDFMVYDRLILGSSGKGENPTNDDAVSFFQKHWRWFETWDKDFEHMTPIQGDWTIDGIHLPDSTLRKVYFDNARKLLAGSLPTPILKAHRIANDFSPDAATAQSVWDKAEPVWIDYESKTVTPRPRLSTTVRALWSANALYLRYESPYTELTTFQPPKLDSERIGLWEKDVVEAFIGSDPSRPKKYKEFQTAPTGDKLDLSLELPDRDFDWSSGFRTDVVVNESKKRWIAEWRIPFSAFDKTPKSGDRWLINLYRCDYANNALMAWNPTLNPNFHTPERFGRLAFESSHPDKAD